MTVCSYGPRRTRTASPDFTSRDGFTRSPFTVTLPLSIAVTAMDLDLKNRAAQSHLSTRTDALFFTGSRNMMHNTPSVPLLFAVALTACTSGAENQARAERAARTAIAAESSTATLAASMPSTGKWDEPHLVERLVRAGLAPRAMRDAKAEEYWHAPVLAYQLGSAILHAYIYPDSLARRDVTRTLDAVTASPRGKVGPYPLRHILIVQNNLAAVLVGGSDTQQERVRLALEAGLPAASPR